VDSVCKRFPSSARIGSGGLSLDQREVGDGIGQEVRGAGALGFAQHRDGQERQGRDDGASGPAIVGQPSAAGEREAKA